MPLRWCLCAALAAFGAGACFAEQVVSQPTPPGEEDNLFREINERLKRSVKARTPEQAFKQTVDLLRGDPANAPVCPACKKPYYFHSDPNFECVPEGPLRHDGTRAKPLRIQETQVPCPACQSQFNAAYQANINSRAGLDRDFCQHSVGRDAVVHASVWLCPDCGYAAPADKLNDGQVEKVWGLDVDGSALKPETLKLVRERLSEWTREQMIEAATLRKESVTKELLDFGTYLKQTQIPDWVKYKNALFLLENGPVKAPHSMRARLYMEAAWACRREVCSEIGITGMVPQFQELLGKSIRRMNYYMQGQSMNVRKAAGETFVDPAKPETDAYVQAQAADEIIRIGERVVQLAEEAKKTRPPDAPPIDVSRFTVGDIFVLRLKQAGYLDRIGRIRKAYEALEEARKIIPSEAEIREGYAALDIKNSEEFIEADLKKIKANIERLFRTIDIRADCLRMEREYLYNAGNHLIQALYFKENAGKLDPSLSLYWAGEFFRRDGREPEVAQACFEAALKILNGEDLLELRKQVTKAEAARKGMNASAEEIRLKERLVRLETLISWSEAHHKETAEEAQKVNRPVRENVATALAEILKRVGAQHTPAFAAAEAPAPAAGDAGGEPAPAEAKPAAMPGTNPLAMPGQEPEKKPGKASAVQTAEPKTPEPGQEAPPAAAGGVKTRYDLYRRYHEAIKAYVKDKHENPDSLAALVEAGFIPAAESGLDEKGALRCPENGGKILYSRTVKLGEHMAILFPIHSDANKTKLYADGVIGE